MVSSSLYFCNASPAVIPMKCGGLGLGLVVASDILVVLIWSPYESSLSLYLLLEIIPRKLSYFGLYVVGIIFEELPVFENLN